MLNHYIHSLIHPVKSIQKKTHILLLKPLLKNIVDLKEIYFKTFLRDPF